jgi:hypothetical protein
MYVLPLFHGGNRGSNPLGDANHDNISEINILISGKPRRLYRFHVYFLYRGTRSLGREYSLAASGCHHPTGRLSPHQIPIDRDHRAGNIVGQGSVARNSTSLAQSSTVPSRRRATNSARSRLLWLLPGMAVCMIRPVAITPGAMQITVIPYGPRS